MVHARITWPLSITVSSCSEAWSTTFRGHNTTVPDVTQVEDWIQLAITAYTVDSIHRATVAGIVRSQGRCTTLLPLLYAPPTRQAPGTSICEVDQASRFLTAQRPCFGRFSLRKLHGEPAIEAEARMVLALITSVVPRQTIVQPATALDDCRLTLVHGMARTASMPKPSLLVQGNVWSGFHSHTAHTALPILAL